MCEIIWIFGLIWRKVIWYKVFNYWGIYVEIGRIVEIVRRICGMNWSGVGWSVDGGFVDGCDICGLVWWVVCGWGCEDVGWVF